VLTKRLITILLVAVFAIGGLVSCKGSDTAASYKIGVASAQTGVYSGLGLQCMEGIQLIVDDVNEGGGINGIPLEIIAYDDKSEATEVAKVANKLIEVDKVHALIAGTTTNLANFMIPVANEAKVPAEILSGTALLDNELGAWVFRPMGAEWDYITLDLVYLRDNVGISKYATLLENSGYGQGGKVFLPKLSPDFNMTIVEEQTFDPGATDLSPQLVAEFGEWFEMEPSICMPATKIDVWEQLPDNDSDKAMCCEFAGLCLEKTGHPPTMWNVLGAQMTLQIEDGLRRANADPGNVVETRSKLRDAMESAKDLELLTSTFTLSPTDHYGGFNQKMVLITFKDGEKVLVQ